MTDKTQTATPTVFSFSLSKSSLAYLFMGLVALASASPAYAGEGCEDEIEANAKLVQVTDGGDETLPNRTAMPTTTVGTRGYFEDQGGKTRGFSEYTSSKRNVETDIGGSGGNDGI